MSQNKKVLILSTRLNSVWTSMQEIIPGLEKLWGGLSEEGPQIVLCEEMHLKKDLHLFLEADVIIVTAFNVVVAKTLNLIRRTLSIDTPWIFYLHNQATIGLWPLYYWKIGDLLKTNDQFISTCSRDAQCFNQLFKNKQARVIPFHYFPLDSLEGDYVVKTDDFIYVGRISSQKNLHTLILSFSLMQESQAHLHFFGEEDHLGSPNMGTKDSGYLKSLQDLCHSLKIDKRVHFHGFVKREVIETILIQMKPIFISPSLHSDENFGMAAMRALFAKCRVVLSNWGGHFDFYQQFQTRVELVKVYQGSYGPFINPLELAQVMKKTLLKKSSGTDDSHYYQYSHVQSLAREVLGVMKKEDALDLIKLDILKNVLERVTRFHDPPNGMIFEDYQDQLAHRFFSAYGASEDIPETKGVLLCPWVEKRNSGYEVNDPHRGTFSLEDDAELRKAGYLF